MGQNAIGTYRPPPRGRTRVPCTAFNRSCPQAAVVVDNGTPSSPDAAIGYCDVGVNPIDRDATSIVFEKRFHKSLLALVFSLLSSVCSLQAKVGWRRSLARVLGCEISPCCAHLCVVLVGPFHWQLRCGGESVVVELDARTEHFVSSPAHQPAPSSWRFRDQTCWYFPSRFR